MNARKWLPIVAAAILSLNCSAAFAQGNGHGKGHEKNKHGDDDSRPQVVYSSEQREAVNGWYRDHRNNLPPGLAKRDQLPPGLAKQVQERGTLPPGLQKKIQPVPVDLERRLPPPPEGCECRHVIVGGNLILLNPRTSYIYSVFHFEI